MKGFSQPESDLACLAVPCMSFVRTKYGIEGSLGVSTSSMDVSVVDKPPEFR